MYTTIPDYYNRIGVCKGLIKDSWKNEYQLIICTIISYKHSFDNAKKIPALLGQVFY
jgi:hypothetical protein